MHSCHLAFAFACQFQPVLPHIYLWPFSFNHPEGGILAKPQRLRVCKRDFVCLHLQLLLGPELRVSWLQLTPYQLILVAELKLQAPLRNSYFLDNFATNLHFISYHLFEHFGAINLIYCISETILVPKDQLISALKNGQHCLSRDRRFTVHEGFIHTCVWWPAQFIPGMAKENPYIPFEDEAPETCNRICFESDRLSAGQCMEVGRGLWLDKGWRWPGVWQGHFHVGHSIPVWHSCQDAPGFWCLLQPVQTPRNFPA